MEWISVKNKAAAKNGKFLFNYHCGTGIGEWGQAYTITNGNSERSHAAYILVLDPISINDGNEPFQWTEEYMIHMDVLWMPLPPPPKN